MQQPFARFICFYEELLMTYSRAAGTGGYLRARLFPRVVSHCMALLLFVFIGPVGAASNAAAADRQDPFAVVLMEKGIEAYSSASDKGDEAAADALLDADVLFSGGDGAVQRDEKRDRHDVISALLQRQAQAVFDAGELGDRAAQRRYLHPDLLSVNENGTVLPRGDAAGIAPAVPAGGMSASDKLTQWVVHHSGNAAVASFVDEQLVHGADVGEQGQVQRPKYLVVQTWVKRGTEWKLFGSQTIPLHQDPSVAALPAPVWNEYVGSYGLAPGVTAVLARDGDVLTSSTNGAKPVRYVPESMDAFYSPGMAEGALRPRIFFQRDETGRVSGYLSSSGAVLKRVDGASMPPTVAPSAVKSQVLPAQQLVVRRSGDVAVATFVHERVTQYYGQELHTRYRSTETWIKQGHAWKMLALQSRALENDVTANASAVPALNDYVGTYRLDSGNAVTLTLAGGTLLATGKDGAPTVLNPLARDFFAPAGSPRTSIVFQRDASGRVAGYCHRREGRDLLYART